MDCPDRQWGEMGVCNDGIANALKAGYSAKMMCDEPSGSSNI